MRRAPFLLGLALGLAALAPDPATARAGMGGSYGSRGGRTYSAPAPTRMAPYSAPLAPYAAPRPNYGYGAAPAYAPPRRSHPFLSGLAGGFLGYGLGSLLFGHGGGYGGGYGGGGFGGFLGTLLWIGLLVLAGRFVWRWLSRRNAGGSGMGGGMGGFSPAAPPAGDAPIAVDRADYASFDRLLREVQSAWSDRDVSRLRALTTPDMLGWFNGQLAELDRRGHRNSVTDVRLEKGELSEAWREGGFEYATVAMRYAMRDVTRDRSGAVVDGSAEETVTATELWTFVRRLGEGWVVSAIQQGR